MRSLLSCSTPMLLVSLLVACGPAPEDEVHTRSSFVVNGTVYSGHPSAGKLTRSGSLCTATLVGKKTVITAAHCVSPGYTHTFTVGGVAYQSAKAVRHPQYNSYQITNDIAVIILQSAPPITGATIATSATKPTVGLEVTIVGYGKTSEYISDAGTKRMAKNNISEVTSTRLRIPGSSTKGGICNGDSGGPSYATINGVEVQVGVHSTKSGACGSGGHDTRVDVFADWITQEAGGDVNKPGTTNPGGGGGTNPGGGGTNPQTDTQAPKVAITYPTAGATVSKSLTVTTQISDDKGVTKIELSVDNKVVASGTAKSFPITLTSGQHLLKVVAQDAAKNQGQATVAVTVDGGGTDPDPKPGPDPDPTPKPDPNPAPQPGAYGSSCQSQDDCLSGLCADDQTLGQQYCTQTCSPTQPCPTGSTCFSNGATGQSVCGLDSPSPDLGGGGNNNLDGQLLGSCAVTDVRDPWMVLPLLALLLLWRRRRRA